MSKKKLCTPLSTFLLRRTLTSIPEQFPSSFKLPLHASPSPPFDDRFCHNPTCYYSLRFCGKTSFAKSAEKLQITCWNCHALPPSAPFLFCDSCRCIQPVDDSIDYFEIFGEERKYDIEGSNLEGKYKEWQKKLHPDLVHSKSQKERDFAAEQSARVIDAYRTLSKPLSRGIYMIMEIREAVEEATNSEALNHIRSQMQEKLQNLSNAFAHAFQRRNFEEAKNAIKRMTYYNRVIDEVVKKL